MTTKRGKTIAILGAGKLGTVLAQLAIRAGYDVYIAGSGAVDKIQLSVQVLIPGAVASTAKDAIDHADIVILALPLGKYRTILADALDGKLVIDAMNYWWEVDGTDKSLTRPETSSSEIIQDFLSGARVVKALSHMGYHHLLDEAKPSGTADRKAIAVAGDDPRDTETATSLVNDLGFDPVVIGPLASGKILEPGHEPFGSNIDKQSLIEIAQKSDSRILA